MANTMYVESHLLVECIKDREISIMLDDSGELGYFDSEGNRWKTAFFVPKDKEDIAETLESQPSSFMTPVPIVAEDEEEFKKLMSYNK